MTTTQAADTPVPDPRFHPTPVDPVPPGVARPFWSVMVPTYNRPELIKQALGSILEQDPGPERMQIGVVDNASTICDTAAVVGALAGDRVTVFRNPTNVGGVANINCCIGHSIGQWVHVLHDDDMVMPGFYSAYEKVIDRHPDASLVMAPMAAINSDGFAAGWTMVPRATKPGPVSDFLLNQATGNYAPTPALVVPRWVYENVGGYAEKLKFGPDWEMAFRAGTCGTVVTLGPPLALYRWHEGNDTATLITRPDQVLEAKAIIDELCSRLPPDQKSRLPANRYKWLADLCDTYARALAGRGENAARLSQLEWAQKLDPSRQRLRALWRARISGIHRRLRGGGGPR